MAPAKFQIKLGYFLANVAAGHVVERFTDRSHIVQKILVRTIGKPPLVERFLGRNCDLPRGKLLAKKTMKAAQIYADISAH